MVIERKLFSTGLLIDAISSFCSTNSLTISFLLTKIRPMIYELNTKYGVRSINNVYKYSGRFFRVLSFVHLRRKQSHREIEKFGPFLDLPFFFVKLV